MILLFFQLELVYEQVLVFIIFRLLGNKKHFKSLASVSLSLSATGFWSGNGTLINRRFILQLYMLDLPSLHSQKQIKT